MIIDNDHTWIYYKHYIYHIIIKNKTRATQTIFWYYIGSEGISGKNI